MNETPDLEKLHREHDEALIQAAREKLSRGERPNKRELTAWTRFDSQQLESYGLRFVEKVPQKLYCERVGRNARIVRNHCQDFSLPIGPTVALFPVLERFHELLIDHRGALLESVESASEETLDRERSARADLLEIKRDAELQTLIHKDQARNYHTRLSAILRGAGERLGRRFGADAQEILDEALDDCEGVINELFEGKDG